jgi:hypothetical protein
MWKYIEALEGIETWQEIKKQAKMSIAVKNEFVLDNNKKIQWKKRENWVYKHYRVRIYLSGTKEELSTVEQVTYILHYTFRKKHGFLRIRTPSSRF